MVPVQGRLRGADVDGMTGRITIQDGFGRLGKFWLRAYLTPATVGACGRCLGAFGTHFGGRGILRASLLETTGQFARGNVWGV